MISACFHSAVPFKIVNIEEDDETVSLSDPRVRTPA